MITFEFYNNIARWLEYKDCKSLYVTYDIKTLDYPEIHGHKDYTEFGIITDGKICNRINGKNEYYHSPSMFITCPNDVHSVHRINRSNLRFINIIVKQDYLENLCNAISPDLIDIIKNGKRSYLVSKDFIRDIEQIIHVAAVDHSKSAVMLSKILSTAVVHILQTIFYESLTEESSHKSWKVELSKISQTPQFLTFKVDDLCRELNYSKMQLTRLFRTEFNMTPHEYLLDIKFQYAKSLLVSSDLKINEISNMIGYPNPSLFTANFKKKYNVSPMSLRIKNNDTKEG